MSKQVFYKIILEGNDDIEFYADENFPMEVEYALTHGTLLKICTCVVDYYVNPQTILYIKKYKNL